MTFWQMTVSAPQTHGLNSKGLLQADVLFSAGTPPPRFVYVVVCDHGVSDSKRPVSIMGECSPNWASAMTQHMLILDFGAGAVQSANEARAALGLLDQQISQEAI
jgi:hypothetical protein